MLINVNKLPPKSIYGYRFTSKYNNINQTRYKELTSGMLYDLYLAIPPQDEWYVVPLNSNNYEITWTTTT